MIGMVQDMKQMTSGETMNSSVVGHTPNQSTATQPDTSTSLTGNISIGAISLFLSCLLASPVILSLGTLWGVENPGSFILMLFLTVTMSCTISLLVFSQIKESFLKASNFTAEKLRLELAFAKDELFWIAQYLPFLKKEKKA